jgi:hypothetical protein
MKKMKLAALALVGVLATGNALAATQATLDVTATVTSTCTIVKSADINFGSIDPVTATGAIKASDASGAGSVIVKCTAGITPTLAASAVVPMKLGGTGAPLAFTGLMPTISSAPGATNTTPYAVDAEISLAAIQAASAGSYSAGTLTVTVSGF